MKKSNSTDALIGKTIDSKYLILEKIDGGGMGSVYVADHIYLKHRVALKIMHSHLASDDEYIQRFQREARTAFQIKHPNAVTLHDFGVDGDYPYLAMDLIQGRSLKKVIAEESPLSISRIYSIVSQMSLALAEAHFLGVIHRDLKPDNILIDTGKDGRDFPVILDFGIAKVLEFDGDADPMLTKAGTIFGTPKYMAPEQAFGKVIDTRADLYSLGVVIYEMLSNRLPFDSGSVMEAMMKHASEEPPEVKDVTNRTDVTDEMNSVVARLLKKDPDERYQTVDEFLEDFTRVFSPGGTVSIRTGSTSRITHESKLGLARYFGMAVVGVVVGVGFSSLNIFGIGGSSKEPQLLERKAKQEVDAARQATSLEQQRVEEVRRDLELLVRQRREEELLVEKMKAEAAQASEEARKKKEELFTAVEEVESIKDASAVEALRAEKLRLEAEEAARLAEQAAKEAARIKDEVERARSQKAATEAARERKRLEALKAIRAAEAARLKLLREEQAARDAKTDDVTAADRTEADRVADTVEVTESVAEPPEVKESAKKRRRPRQGKRR